MKSNIYKRDSPKKHMNKRGEAVTMFAIIASLFVAGSVLVGTYLATEKQPSNLNQTINYVGDSITLQVYDASCYNKIKSCNLVIFNTLEQAKDLNFTYSKECPK